MRVIALSIRDKPAHHRERHPAHDNSGQQIPGWSAERTPKDEPYIANKNLSLGRWISRAEANSGPKIAPGCGTRKSS
jgi:hypothetical protein